MIVIDTDFLVISRSEISVALNFHTKKSVTKLRRVPRCFPLATPLVTRLIFVRLAVQITRAAEIVIY